MYRPTGWHKIEWDTPKCFPLQIQFRYALHRLTRIASCKWNLFRGRFVGAWLILLVADHFTNNVLGRLCCYVLLCSTFMRHPVGLCPAWWCMHLAVFNQHKFILLQPLLIIIIVRIYYGAILKGRSYGSSLMSVRLSLCPARAPDSNSCGHSASSSD